MPKKLPLPNEAKKRFWRSVKKTKHCWNWTGATYHKGYGSFSYMRVNYRAHRVALAWHLNIDPKKKFVCHKCDNPSCVKPSHLFLGDVKINSQDSASKKRHWAQKNPNKARKIALKHLVPWSRSFGGLKNANSKFDLKTLLRIYKDLKNEKTATFLSEKYGVSADVIRCIKSGKKYKEEYKKYFMKMEVRGET